MKPRELAHDARLYATYKAETARIEREGGRVTRVVLDYELKRDYQKFLNREDRPDDVSLDRDQATPHTLPHTALSWVAQHGEPLQKIARFAGHSSTHVTETFYAHLQPEHQTHAAGVIDSVLGTFFNHFLNHLPRSDDK